jgi:hypothetical protein
LEAPTAALAADKQQIVQRKAAQQDQHREYYVEVAAGIESRYGSTECVPRSQSVPKRANRAMWRAGEMRVVW